MAISSATSKAGPYAGNAATTVFAFSFYTLATGDIQVLSTAPVGGVPSDTVLTLGVDYTVSLNADQTVAPGGSITMLIAPPVGISITVLRNISAVQTASFPNQGGFYPKVLENALDRLTMIVQQMLEESSRSIKFSVGSTTITPADIAAQAASAAVSADRAAANADRAAAGAAFIDSNPVVKGSADATKQIRFEVDGLTPGTTRVITVPDKDGVLVMASDLGLSNLRGRKLSRNTGTPNTVLDIAAGYARDSTNTVGIAGTGISKSISSTWAAGSGNGGMGQGLTATNGTWYHFFDAIINGAYDAFFDTSITAANKPAGTTAFARAGSILLDSSGHIANFVHNGKEIRWAVQVVDLNGAPPSVETLLALTIPPDVEVHPKLSALYRDGTVGNSYQAWSPDASPTAKNELFLSAQVANVDASETSDSLLSNTSKQIYHKTNGANSPNVILYTLGWIDPSLADV